MAILKIVVLTLITLGLHAGVHPDKAAAATVHAIVDLPGGCLLGGSASGRWLQPKAAARLLRGGEKYRLYTLTRAVGRAVGSRAHSAGEPCPETLEVKIAPMPRGETRIIAVGGSWNALPRVPRLTSTGQPTFRDAAAQILKSKGILNPQVRLTQVIRIDLEGDGLEEVLVAATHYQGKMHWQPQAGDYSMVFLRRLIQGRVQTTVIQGEFYPRTRTSAVPNEYRVAALLDVNNDGKMEIILHSQYFEGEETTLYQVMGRRVIKVLSCGCGA
jgi:hypothetical protein